MATPATATAFARHVEVDEGVLATTAPLELKLLDRIVLLVAEGLVRVPDKQQRAFELHEKLMTQRTIGAAEAVSGMLELLAEHEEADEFFKASVVKVLTGERLPLRAPQFAGAVGTAEQQEATITAATPHATTPLTPAQRQEGSPQQTNPVQVAATSVAAATAVAAAPPTKTTTATLVAKATVSPPVAAASPAATASQLPTPMSVQSSSSPQQKAASARVSTVVSPTTPSNSPLVRTSTSPVPSPMQTFAPMPTPKQHQRKRSLDSTYSSSGEQPSDDKKGKRVSKRRMSNADVDAKGQAMSSSPSTSESTKGKVPKTKDRHDRSLHPIYSVPTPWEELHYKPVQVIDMNMDGAKDQIQALRFAGTPFILEGYSGWMKFAADWVLPNGSLDSEAFLRGTHDVKVPVIEKNYEDTNPIKTHLPLSYYVRNYWEKGKPDYYMHQWQFPLSPKAAKLLCYKCEELPVIGDNLLLYWLDAVRGDNPLQYFFMGQRNTNSRMHQDPGGLDITIAPIVGTKRVTMLHKSAAKLDSVHDNVNFHDVDLDKIPLLAFIPAWRVDIKPGQILYMPEGTFHACENITACLSYHRFHVDAVNMPGFLASFMAQDSPSINHAEILWNAVHDVMASLEENYHANGQGIDDEVATLRKLDSLRALRHASRILSLEETLPTEDSWDWKKLLDDIDHLLVRIDPHVLQMNLDKRGAGASSNANGASSVAAKFFAAVPATTQTHAQAVDASHTNPRDVKVEISASAVARPLALAVGGKSRKVATTHWDELKLKVGDTIGVQVYEKRNKAKVLKVALNMELVQVHYVDWGSIYDEFLPVSSLYQRSTRSSKRVALRKAPKVHEPVLAKWGSGGQLYNAIVLKVIRSNACLVHYLKYENDWNQWILPGHIFKKYSLKE